MTTPNLSRRSLLGLAGAGAGAIILSGCGGDDDSGSSNKTTGSATVSTVGAYDRTKVDRTRTDRLKYVDQTAAATVETLKDDQSLNVTASARLGIESTANRSSALMSKLVQMKAM